jgi:hypothetical protein
MIFNNMSEIRYLKTALERFAGWGNLKSVTLRPFATLEHLKEVAIGLQLQYWPFPLYMDAMRKAELEDVQRKIVLETEWCTRFRPEAEDEERVMKRVV